MKADIVRRLDHWLQNEHVDDADQILVDARDEIISLRERLAEGRDVLMGSMRETGKYAHRAGYCEGTLMLIQVGHHDPAAAAKAALDHAKEGA
jgi:hypothetical protein